MSVSAYGARLLRKIAVAFLLLMATVIQATASNTVAVIVHPDVEVDRLSLASLRATYSMRVRHWPDGIPVRVFVLPDRHSLHVSFSREILRVYPYVLRDTWDRAIFTGTGRAPIEVENQQEMLRRVAETPGAIGYIHRGDISDANFKVLQIR